MSTAANYSDSLDVLYYGYAEAEVAVLAADPLPLANRHSTILGLLIPFLCLSWFCVVFRLYTRLRIVRSAGWDDLFVFLSLMVLTLSTAAIVLACFLGHLGEHFMVLTPLQAGAFLLSFYIMNASYTLSTALIKLSLLFQYTRLFESGSGIRRLCWFLIGFTALWGFAYSFIAWFPCSPAKNFWLGNGQHCYGYGSSDPGPFVATYESHSSVNMLLDLLVLAIPIPLYFERDTTSKTRMGLVGLLFMGAIVNFVSIWRLATVIQHKAATYPTHDPTWWGDVTIILATLEVDIACVCASVPVFWPVLEARFGRPIFVEHEVHITREDFWTASRGGDGGGDSEAEFGKAGAVLGLGLGMDRPRHKTNESMGSPDDFKEVYVLSQIDPLRGERTAVQVTVRSASQVRRGSRMGGKRLWWRL